MGLRTLLDHTRVSMLARQLLCLLLLTLACTGTAFAQLGNPTGDGQSGAPNQTLPQQLTVTNTSTFAPVDVLWYIILDDSNGATISSPSDQDTGSANVVINLISGASGGVSLTFGPSGGDVTLAACEATNPGTGWVCSTTPIVFGATAVAPTWILSKVSADPINATVGDNVQTTVRVLDAFGLPISGQDIRFLAPAGSVTPDDVTVPTDLNGFAVASMTATQAGTQANALSATLDQDGIPANGDEQTVTYSFNFLAAPPNFTGDAGADNQSGNPGDTLALPLNATNSGGAGIALWRIITDGSGGASLNLAGDLSALADEAAISIPTTGTAGPTLTLGPNPGSVSIEACEGQLQTGGYVCISPIFYTFAAVALPPSLNRVTADPINSVVGSSFSVTVELNDGLSNGIPGASVQFATTPGLVSLDNTTAVTDGSGNATATFTALQAGNFPTAMTVSHDPDGIPLSGDELAVTYGLNFAVAPAGTLIKPAVNSGDGQSGIVGVRLDYPLRAQALDGGGTPEPGVTINWTVISGSANLDQSSSVTAATGVADMGLTFTTEGSVTVRAERADIPGAIQDYLLSATTAAPTTQLDIVSGDNQSSLPDQPGEDLVVRLSSGGSPVISGMIVWSVVSGDATLAAASSPTDSNGEARVGISFGPTTGPVVISAQSDDPVAGPVYFHHQIQTSGTGTIDLYIHAGDGQAGPITTQADNPLVALLVTGGGVPIVGTPISWSVVSGDAVLGSSTSNTDSAGLASVDFSFGPTAGTSIIRASTSSGTVFVDFQVTAYLPMLALQSGDGQSGPVNSLLDEDFVIAIAPPSTPLAKSLAGVDIQWQVIEGGGSLDATSTATDSNGIARTRLRLGPNPGSNVVRAEIAGGPSLVFHATGLVNPTATSFRIVSGNGQQLPTKTASEPLVVEVLDGNEEPLPGVALEWSIDNGSLQMATSGTGADGRSSNIAQVTIPGAAEVHVSVQSNPDLALSFSLNGGVANILDLNDDEHEVAVAIDTLCPALLAMESHTAEQQDLLDRCLELVDNAGRHPDQVIGALNEMMADISLVQAQAALLAATAQSGNIRQRLAALRAGERKPLSLDGLALANSSGVLPLALLPEAGSDDEIGTDFSRWGFFANGTLGRGDSSSGGSRPEYNYDTAGLTAGVDYRINDHWFAGVAVGFTRQDNKLTNDGGHVNVRGWSLSGYTTWFNASNWYVDGVLNWGSNDYDLQRRIAYQIQSGASITSVDQVAEASSGGDQLYAALSFGRDFQKGAWNIGPYGRASWVRVGFDAYEERLLGSGAGSGLGLHVETRDVNATLMTLGGKASRAISTDWGVLMPNFSLEWEHQLQDDPQHVVASFLADPTQTAFEIGGTALDRDYYRLGIGLSALWANGRSGFVTYEQLLGASGISQGNLSLGIRIEF